MQTRNISALLVATFLPVCYWRTLEEIPSKTPIYAGITLCLRRASMILSAPSKGRYLCPHELLHRSFGKSTSIPCSLSFQSCTSHLFAQLCLGCTRPIEPLVAHSQSPLPRSSRYIWFWPLQRQSGPGERSDRFRQSHIVCQPYSIWIVLPSGLRSQGYNA